MIRGRRTSRRRAGTQVVEGSRPPEEVEGGVLADELVPESSAIRRGAEFDRSGEEPEGLAPIAAGVGHRQLVLVGRRFEAGGGLAVDPRRVVELSGVVGGEPDRGLGVGDGLAGPAELDEGRGPAAEGVGVGGVELQGLVEVAEGRGGRPAEEVDPAPVGEQGRRRPAPVQGHRVVGQGPLVGASGGQGEPPGLVQCGRRAAPGQAGVELADGLVVPPEHHQGDPPGPVDFGLVRLEPEGLVGRGQRLLGPAGLLQDQRDFQMVGGRGGVVRLHQPDRPSEVVERLFGPRPEAIDLAPRPVEDRLVGMAGDGLAEGLQRVVPSAQVPIGHREVDVRLELAGLQGDGPGEVVDGVVVAAPTDAHHAPVDQHDVPLLVVELELGGPPEILLGEVELPHLPLGEALQEIGPGEPGSSTLAGDQRRLRLGGLVRLQEADRQEILGPESVGLERQRVAERLDGPLEVAPTVGLLADQEVIDGRPIGGRDLVGEPLLGRGAGGVARAFERRGASEVVCGRDPSQPSGRLEDLQGQAILPGGVLAGERAGDRVGEQEGELVAARVDLLEFAGLEVAGVGREVFGVHVPVGPRRPPAEQGQAPPGRVPAGPDVGLGVEPRVVRLVEDRLVVKPLEGDVASPGRFASAFLGELRLAAGDEVLHGAPGGAEVGLRADQGRGGGELRPGGPPLPPTHGVAAEEDEPVDLLFQRDRPPAGLVVAAGGLRPTPFQAEPGAEDRQRGDQDQGGGRGPTPDPLAGPLADRGPSRLDRLVGEEGGDVVGQVVGGLVATLGLLREALQADRLEVAVDERLEPPGRDGVRILDEVEGRQDRRRHERGAAGQEFVEVRPQGVDVGGGADVLGPAVGLLGGHVVGRAEDRLGPGQARVLFEGLGQAEVGNLGLAGQGHEDVGGLEVAMDDPESVGLGGGAGQVLQEPRGGPGGPGGPVEPGAEAPPLDVLELDVGPPVPVADGVDLNDVRVPEPGDRLGLGGEPGERVGAGVVAGQDHLECDDPVESDLAGLVDDPHRPPAELAQDLVAGQLGLLGGLRLRSARRGEVGFVGRPEPRDDPVVLLGRFQELPARFDRGARVDPEGELAGLRRLEARRRPFGLPTVQVHCGPFGLPSVMPHELLRSPADLASIESPDEPTSGGDCRSTGP